MSPRDAPLSPGSKITVHASECVLITRKFFHHLAHFSSDARIHYAVTPHVRRIDDVRRRHDWLVKVTPTSFGKRMNLFAAVHVEVHSHGGFPQVKFEPQTSYPAEDFKERAFLQTRAWHSNGQRLASSYTSRKYSGDQALNYFLVEFSFFYGAQ